MAEKPPSLSIIVISYNTRKITIQCIESILESLKNRLFSYEIIIVDNASIDDSIEYINKLTKLHENIVLIENEQNVGFGRANNQAAKIAQGKYLLFLNSDTIILNHAIDLLFNFYQKHEAIVHFLGGKLLNKDLSPQASAGYFYTPFVVFAALFLRGDYWNFTRSSPDKIIRSDWVSGACILTQKRYFQQLNGFDEQVFMYMDEVDLLYRAKKQHLLTYFYPEAKFVHLGSASSNGKTYPILQVYRGLIYFYKKHYSSTSLILLKFMLQLKALIALIIGKITRNSYLIKTYEKAYQLAR